MTDNKITIKTVIEWHDAITDPPPKSGMYLVLAHGKLLSSSDYSKKHNMFNVCDFFDEDTASKCALPVTRWARTYDIKNILQDDKQGGTIDDRGSSNEV